MKTHSLPALSLMGALLCAASIPASAQDSLEQYPPEWPAHPAAPARAGSAEIMVTVDVTGVDRDDRLLTVKGPRGKLTTFYVDKSVAAFDKVRVGDQIIVDYRAAVAVALRKGGESIREQVQSEYSSPVPGYETGKARTRRTTLVANVEDIDAKRRVATLKGPNGRVVEVEIQDPKVAAEIARGDQVVAVIDETVALALKPAMSH